MEVTVPSAARQNLLGGRLCLDFVNTVDWHASEHAEEYLTSYAELVAWSLHASILDETAGQRLLTRAALRPNKASAALAEVITFRETLYRIFLASLAEVTPSADDLVVFNAARAQTLAHSEIATTDRGFVWHWKANKDDLDWMLWPITLSAADLLLSADLHQVKECPGPGCGWLFLDTSKNHKRRWCTMEGCGNRAKARSHYQRKRQRARTGERS